MCGCVREGVQEESGRVGRYHSVPRLKHHRHDYCWTGGIGRVREGMSCVRGEPRCCRCTTRMRQGQRARRASVEWELGLGRNRQRGGRGGSRSKKIGGSRLHVCRRSSKSSKETIARNNDNKRGAQ